VELKKLCFKYSVGMKAFWISVIIMTFLKLHSPLQIFVHTILLKKVDNMNKGNIISVENNAGRKHEILM
jgi:hypothetical protein